MTVNLATKRAAYALDGLDQQIVLPDPERYGQRAVTGWQPLGFTRPLTM